MAEADCRLATAESQLARALTTEPDTLSEVAMGALSLIMRARLFMRGLV